MKLEQELRKAMQHEDNHLSPPIELKENIMIQIERIKGKGSKPMKKYIVTTILVAALLIPTGAFAAYSYLTDTLYGSQEKLIEMGGTAAEYTRVESKLQQAQGRLSKEEFSVFMELLKELGAYNLKITDKNGMLHKERLSVDEQREYNRITAELEPYFDKLNQEEFQTHKSIDLQDELDYAKKALSKDEFVKFRVLFTEFYKYVPRITGENGVLYPDRLPEREREDYEEHLRLLQPYFDQFNSLEKKR